jgi:predicted transcriptional regulator
MEEFTVSFILDVELKTALDKFATKNRLSRSDVVRFALKKFLYDGKGAMKFDR